MKDRAYAILYRARDGSSRGAVIKDFGQKQVALHVADRLNALAPKYRHWVVYLRPGLDVAALFENICQDRAA